MRCPLIPTQPQPYVPQRRRGQQASQLITLNMTAPDAVLGLAEVGSSAVSALLSSQTSLPAACTRSFSHVRSFHRRTATTRPVPASHPSHRSKPDWTRTSLHSSQALSLTRCTARDRRVCFTSRPAAARFFTSSGQPSTSKASTASSPTPARLTAEFEGPSVDGVANPRLFQPPSFISDAAQHLSSQQHMHLSIRLNALHSHCGIQFAVVTVRSVELDDDEGSIRDWAVRLFNQWGVGRRPENDGILVVLVEKQQRVEVVLGDGCRMQTGLTNNIVEMHIALRMVPWFQKEQYGMGLTEGVDALVQAVRQSQSEKPRPATTTLLSEQEPRADGGVGGGHGGGDKGGANDGRGTGWGGGGSKGWSGVTPNFMRGVLSLIAAIITMRVISGQWGPPSTSSSTPPPTRCSRCQGKLKLVGVVDRTNISSTSSFDSTALQSIDRPDTRSSTTTPTFSSFPADDGSSSVTLTEGNLYLADYRVDYQHALDSLSAQQAERLRQSGVQYQVYVCPDCSTLYLQESEAEEKRPLADAGDRMFDRTPFIGTRDIGGRGGLSGVGAGAMGGDSGAAASSVSRKSEVVWLPSAPRHVKRVRRESDMSGSSSGGSGFGGGSSSGGGAGASF